MISSYIIPILISFILAYSLFKKNNTYNSFVNGSKTAFTLVIETLPFLIAIFILIEVFTKSGLSILISNTLAPTFKLLGIPKELCELVIIKPFSGSGSIAILENIFKTYGVDSYISRCACTICASGETIFFVSAVYFSKTKIQNLKYTIPVALISNLIGAICGCFLCKFM